jgi:hypothetical protein
LCPAGGGWRVAGAMNDRAKRPIEPKPVYADFECHVVPGNAGFVQNCGARSEPAGGCWSLAYTTRTPP